MNAIIIEDESLIARELQHKLSQVAPDVKVLEVLPSLKVAYKWFLNNKEPDMMLADIQLGDGVIFELFDRYELKCPVVFTTAYDEFAIRAFKVNGVDYLLKPVDKDELKKAIDKCRKLVDSQAPYPVDIQQLMKLVTQPSLAGTAYKEKFIVKFRNQWLPVLTKDIACFYRDQLNYLMTFNGEKHIVDFTTLDEIEELLDPKLYCRANRQYIVHIDAIQSVKPVENQKLVITLKAPMKMVIEMSREKAPAFKKWFDR
ncbi:MAG TPA: LytTR family DNA-binding domain-containing protein [Saprospiraceae bacterium]|nr:LytTR family DNA-binding domain-containing protein [Saprospiraceae bacterium]